MRQIDADALETKAKTIYMEHGNVVVPTRVIPLSDLHLAPTIDAVPVVRCEDCKHFMEFTETFRERIKFDGSCRLLVGFTDCDREMRKYTEYCSNGERKDGARGMTHGSE